MPRPKGKKDSVKLKPRSPSVNIKSKKKNVTTAAVKKNDPKAMSTDIDTAAVSNSSQANSQAKPKNADFEPAKINVTPYPRSGDNPEFVSKLDEFANINSKVTNTSKPDSARRQADKDTHQLHTDPLNEKDLSEIVGLPFLWWSKINNYDLSLTSDEKKSISEPLCRILNRRNIGQVLNPDLLDGLVLAGRLSPVMVKRFGMILKERERRSKKESPIRQQQEGKGFSSAVAARTAQQGAEFHEPKEF